jgi:LAO/AO transport system kinase
MTTDISHTVDHILNGDVRAAAKLIRSIDDGDPDVADALRGLFPHTGHAHIIGFTGAPGVGKSTLVDRMVSKFRADGKTVGVLAVDPTSPFSGGAILGDRVRMQKHFLDPGVFIRSMATRGAFGGLTRSTADAIIVLDAMGKDVIIVETVGVGQDEVDIVNNAHTVILVTVPGMGDEIQAIKAGLMEIGDIFVVNKCDREGAAKTVREIRFMIHLSEERFAAKGWTPEVYETAAAQDIGVDELYGAVMTHKAFLERGDGERMREIKRARIARQIVGIVKDNLMERAIGAMGGETGLRRLTEAVLAGENDPYAAASSLVDSLIVKAAP